MIIHLKVPTMELGWTKLCQVPIKAISGQEGLLDDPESTIKDKVNCDDCICIMTIIKKEQPSQSAEKGK
jgi:hypothetical protein